MPKAKKQKTRRSREEKTNRLETLLNGLTIDQIRSVFLRLKKEVPKGRRTFAELSDALVESGKSVGEIINAVYEIESAVPQKHFFLVEWSGTIPKAVPNQTFSSDVCPHLKKLKLVHASHEDDHVRFVMEHQVSVEELEEQPDGETYKKVRRLLRHPIFVRVYPSKSLAYVMYPGFSQGRTAKKNRITYKDMVSDVLNALERALGWKFAVIPFRSALDLLSEMESKRLVRIKVTPSSLNGRMSVTTRVDGQSVEDYLSSFVAHGMSAGEANKIRLAIKNALNATPMDQLVAFWVQENLVSRVEFWSTGAEFYFIWNRTEQNFALCAQVFELLRTVLEGLEKSSLLELIRSSRPGDIIAPSDLANRIGGSNTEIRDSLLAATRSGLIEPIYRLKTEALIPDFENVWTKQLSELAREFETDSGTLDGKDPSNIDIAFTRVQVSPQLVLQNAQ